MDVRDLYAYTLALRWRLLEALQAASPELLQRDLGTNHHSILQTLIHVMAVEQSWVNEDLLGRTALTWEEFLERYLGGQETLETLIAGWRRISGETRAYLRSDPDIRRLISLEGAGPETRSVTVEQILAHLAAEEMIHMGEVLAMTRQLGIDLPAYFLMSIMDQRDSPWERWSAES